MRLGLWVCPHVGCSSTYVDVVAAHNHAIDHRREQHRQCWAMFGATNRCSWCTRWSAQLSRSTVAPPNSMSITTRGVLVLSSESKADALPRARMADREQEESDAKNDDEDFEQDADSATISSDDLDGEDN